MADEHKDTWSSPTLAFYVVVLTLFFLVVTTLGVFGFVTLSVLGRSGQKMTAVIAADDSNIVLPGEDVLVPRQKQTATTAQVTPEIWNAIEEQRAAWNRGDLNGYLFGYWNSAEVTCFTECGEIKGFAALTRYLRTRKRADGEWQSQLSYSNLSIEPLGVDCALVRARWQAVTPGRVTSGLFSRVVKRTASGWRISHEHWSEADAE